MIGKLQYISSENHQTHLQNIREACEAGIRWVQLRIKNKTRGEVEDIAWKAKEICNKFGATFILNDDVELAKHVGADGVHVGKEDLPSDQARKILGPDKIIGGTANTFEDLLVHVNAGVDYVGLGPLRFTSTKKKLSPTLGILGYQGIIDKCLEQNIRVPIIAIGGIETEDILPLKEVGVFGVALSSFINEATNKPLVIETMKEKLS